MTANVNARSSPKVSYAHRRIDMIAFVAAIPLFAISTFLTARVPPFSFTYAAIASSDSATITGCSIADNQGRGHRCPVVADWWPDCCDDDDDANLRNVDGGPRNPLTPATTSAVTSRHIVFA
mmetsp:Transcript_15203/g.49516  ORF Transcript_15203/g.49516 Transcript_15203/m.49516 type:complete len:122 (-) Transcript_15203:56-421(-)